MAGPFEIPIPHTISPPTGLAASGTPKHQLVELTWDQPEPGTGQNGFALYRKWLGDSNAPNLCLMWVRNNSKTSYTDIAVAAYENTDDKNRYGY